MTESDQEHINSVAFHKAFGLILQRGAAPQSEFDMDASTDTNLEKPMTAKAAKAARTPATKPLRSINAIQLARLDKQITAFKKRDKKQLYVNGRVHSDDTEKVSLYSLKRGEGGESGAGEARIVRTPHRPSEDRGRDHPQVLTAEAIAEHSALDLFLTACKIPGFEAASARRMKERIPVPVVKKAAAPIPYDGTEPPLMFDSPFLERSQIRPSAICNALAFGSTGSGKTVSFVLPALFSMLAYRLAGGKTASMLVIDPKVELLSAIEEKLTALGELDRLVVVGQCPPISYFDDSRDGLNLNDRFEKVKSLVAVTSTQNDENRWAVFAEQLILSFLKDDQRFANATGLPLLESLAAIVTGDTQYLNRNQWVALRQLLLFGMAGPSSLHHLSDAYDVLTQAVGLTKLDRPLARYCVLKTDDAQWFYNARGALAVVEGLASEDVEPIMDLSVRRGLKKQSNRTDVAALIEQGAVLVFQPRQTATHDLVGAALKALFFRAVLERSDMQRPMAYFADEFQRFYTTDETGEHAFLDRCRAYRTNCFLATQSVAALMAATNRGPNNRGTLEALLVNTTTKAIFRTTDDHTLSAMRQYIPRDPRSDQHVLICRPPASLLTGEVYYVLQAEWGRTRYQLPTQTAQRPGSSNN